MTPAEWSAILIALITGGLLKYLSDFLKWVKARNDDRQPEAIKASEIATVDLSLSVVSKARDELVKDNLRLREQLQETEDRHDAERTRWELRDSARRAEIEVLEARLRALLSEVEKLKDRHLYDDLEQTQSRISNPDK